eukprot:scaffold41655_cov31-Tisochrysis_lutea.AAC.1
MQTMRKTSRDLDPLSQMPRHKTGLCYDTSSSRVHPGAQQDGDTKSKGQTVCIPEHTDTR